MELHRTSASAPIIRRAIGHAVGARVVDHVEKIYQHVGQSLNPETAEKYQTEITSIVSQALEREWTHLAIPDLLALAGNEVNEDAVDQVTVFLEALDVHEERQARYRGVWKESGWRGALFDLRKKAGRLFQEFWNYQHEEPAPEDSLDNAYDLINFAAFFIRARREGNEWGTWR